jgi:hypothetical protein
MVPACNSTHSQEGQCKVAALGAPAVPAQGFQTQWAAGASATTADGFRGLGVEQVRSWSMGAHSWGNPAVGKARGFQVVAVAARSASCTNCKKSCAVPRPGCLDKHVQLVKGTQSAQAQLQS